MDIINDINSLKHCGIYKIQSKLDKRCYVGSVFSENRKSKRNFSKRLSEHRYDLKNQRHHSSHLQRFVNKYGIENLEFEIIESFLNANNTYCYEREMFWIKKFNAYKKGFNSRENAQSNRGHKLTIEHRKQISLRNKGRKINFSEKEIKKRTNILLKYRHLRTTDHLKGSKNPLSKLTEVQVQKIKEKIYLEYPNFLLAAEFNVCKETIHLIKKEKTWTHVKINTQDLIHKEKYCGPKKEKFSTDYNKILNVISYLNEGCRQCEIRNKLNYPSWFINDVKRGKYNRFLNTQTSLG
jgi:group I intron endonuclease